MKKVYLLIIILLFILASVIFARSVWDDKVTQAPESLNIESQNACIYKGNLCTIDDIYNGVLVSLNVNDKENKDFYVIDNTNEKMTLISKDNVLEKVSWNDQTANFFGPTTILSELNKVTKKWNNIPLIKDYEYYDSGFKYYDDRCLNKSVIDAEYECDTNPLGYGYNSLVIENTALVKNSKNNDLDLGEINSRIITKEEVENLMNIASGRTLKWLDVSKPFWTMTTATTKGAGYFLQSYAVISSSNVYGVELYPYYTSDLLASKAVIEIEKSVLDE